MQKKRIQNKRMQMKPTLNVKINLNANVSKIKKGALANITFILNLLSENGMIFVCVGLFSKIKK